MHLPIIDIYVRLIQKNKHYRTLWLGQVVSQLGDWFNLIASAALVANLSNSGLAIGGLFLARLLPPFLLGPIAGVVADRFNRRNILIISDLLRALVVLGFLLIRTEEHIWLVYTLTIVQLSISAFSDPARGAILPDLVDRDDLVTANALDGITWSAMLALGSALGGLVAVLFGVATAFSIDALTFLLSAWLTSYLPVASLTAGQGTTGSQGAGWQAFVDGLGFLKHRPAILVIALLKAASALAFGGMGIIEVTFANDIFPVGNDGSGTLGLIMFSAGLGAVFGPLLARRLTGDNLGAMYWTIPIAFMASFVGYMLIGVAPTLLGLLIATFIRAIGGSTNWVYSSSLLQLMVPGNYLGRVFAFDLAMMTLASSLSTMWVGWATDSLGLTPYQISLILGTIPLLVAIGWVTYLRLGLKQQQILTVDSR